MLDHTHRNLTSESISQVADTYHGWLGMKSQDNYTDVSDFCKSTTLEKINWHNYVLTLGRYVWTAPQIDDSEPFDEKEARLSASQWREQQVEAKRLDKAIEHKLEKLGFGRLHSH